MELTADNLWIEVIEVKFDNKLIEYCQTEPKYNLRRHAATKHRTTKEFVRRCVGLFVFLMSSIYERTRYNFGVLVRTSNSTPNVCSPQFVAPINKRIACGLGKGTED